MWKKGTEATYLLGRVSRRLLLSFNNKANWSSTLRRRGWGIWVHRIGRRWGTWIWLSRLRLWGDHNDLLWRWGLA